MRKLAMKSIQDPRPNNVLSDFVQFVLLLGTLFWETPFFERGLHNMLTLFWSCNQAIEEFLPFVNCHQTQTPWPHLWVDLAVKPGFSGLCNTILLGGWVGGKIIDYVYLEADHLFSLWNIAQLHDNVSSASGQTIVLVYLHIFEILYLWIIISVFVFVHVYLEADHLFPLWNIAQQHDNLMTSASGYICICICICTFCILY